jgi:predicted outer membrane repeat protein
MSHASRPRKLARRPRADRRTRSYSPRTSTLRALTATTVVAAGIIAAIPVAAQAAAVSVPCSETALVGEIITANAKPGSDTLNLAAGCTYRLTRSYGNAGNGPVGLPVITSTIALVGTPNIITRSSLLLFRIAEVSGTGNLTLTRVTLDRGNTLGSGGGVLNRGAVTFTSAGSGLTNNTALGTGGGLSNTDTPIGTAPAATFTGATVSGNTATGRGGGIYNGNRAALTMTSSAVTGNSSLLAQGGGIAAITSTTSLTSTPVSVNSALLGAGGVFRLGGTMTTNTSPISANLPNNCVGSSPAVPNCTA